MKTKTLMIACEVVAKEMGHRLPENLPIRVLDPALHVHPDRLRKTIQDTIDAEEKGYDTLLLGYGRCARAVEGLRSHNATMILPKVDDCIGIFLGSKAAHGDQIKKEPGTFFLSKGWIEAGSTPFEEYAYMVKRFGQTRAESLMKEMLHHYTRLGFIETDSGADMRAFVGYAREKAARFGLRFEEIRGASTLFDRLVKDPAGGGVRDELLIVPPGREITYDMFNVK